MVLLNVVLLNEDCIGMFGYNRRKAKIRRVPTVDPEMESSTSDSSLYQGGREKLLPGGSPSPDASPISSRSWMIVGILYVLLGLVEVLLAGLWRHWIGVVIGFGVAKLGMSLIGIGYTGGYTPTLPPGASILVRLRHIARSIVSFLLFFNNQMYIILCYKI